MTTTLMLVLKLATAAQHVGPLVGGDGLDAGEANERMADELGVSLVNVSDDLDLAQLAVDWTAPAPAYERFPEVAPLGASGMLRVDEDANDDECAQY